jgi:hypothetical protein
MSIEEAMREELERAKDTYGHKFCYIDKIVLKEKEFYLFNPKNNVNKTEIVNQFWRQVEFYSSHNILMAIFILAKNCPTFLL